MPGIDWFTGSTLHQGVAGMLREENMSDQPYGWCKHRSKLGKWEQCIPCSQEAWRTQQKVRKEHGEECTCSICDWDDYWRHLGKQ